MKRLAPGGWILVALCLARLPLAAQETPSPRKPFFNPQDDGKPIPRAIPIPRAVPVPKPGASPGPNTVPAPKPVGPPEPSEPGEIHVTPKGDTRTADQVQLEVADSYYAAKKYEMAAPEYEKYLGQFPTAPDRGIALFRLAESYRHKGTLNAAKNAYETLLGQFGVGDFIGPAAFRLADMYYQEKQYRDALNLYRKASVRLKEPQVANAAKFFSGRCLEALGQKVEARVTYEDLVGQPNENPFYDASRLSLALLLKDSGRTAEAVKHIQALAKQTNNVELKLEATVRGGMWSLELDPPQITPAEAAFKAALAMPGTGYWKELAQLGVVRIQSDMGKYPQVVEAWEKWGKDMSADVKPEFILLAANAQRQLGKSAEALALFNQVSKDFPGSIYDKEAQYERLRTMYAANTEGLLGEIDKYLAANPEAAKRDEALLMKSEVLFKKGDYENAMPIYEALQSSRQLTGNRKADALYRLGICQIETKNIDPAIKTFSTFMDGYPTHKLLPFALLQRGLAFQSVKNLTAALKDYGTLMKDFPKAPQRELALLQQALIQGQEGNNAAMAASFKQLLKDFPETAAKAKANYWIGWVGFENKDYKGCIPPLEEARKLEKEQWGEMAGIRILLSNYYLEDLGGTAREVDRYSKEGKTKVPIEILRYLGKKLQDGHSWESAEKYLLMLASREEVTPDDYFHLAECQLEIPKYKEAVATCQKFLKDTTLPVPRCRGLLLLAKAQIGLGTLDDAQKSADECLMLQPEGEWSGRGRIVAGDIQIARRNFEEAAKIYESVAVILDDPDITPEALEKAVDAWRKAGRQAESDKTLNKLKSRYPEYKIGRFLKP